ncbi:uncharacterized protein LOC142972492 [Anticarsia gemmatalis]|uniref:uncharacterized protein LOC142972492 n=1 Tax=Anticarsia gemmatalis TaxID=129554 RepID=UPI003F761079
MKKIYRERTTVTLDSKMAYKIYLVLFVVYLSVTLVFTRDNAVNHQEFKTVFQLYQSRFKRDIPVLSPGSAVRQVQPNVVVMPSVPNTYGTYPGSSYGVNRAPTVVVSMPNDVYNTPVVANPYGPTRL